MVTLFGLLQHGQVGVQLARLGERDAINPAEHREIAVAMPVGAGALEQLDRLER